MTNTRASLRSDNCPTSIGMSVRFELEQVSDFVGMRKRFPELLLAVEFQDGHVVAKTQPSHRKKENGWKPDEDLSHDRS